MILAKLVAGIVRLGRSPAAVALHGLHPPDRLQAILLRERERSDRTGERFSVVTFTAEDSPRSSAVLAPVARILQRRTRSTDEAGWLSHRQIAVVLPGTSNEGTAEFVDAVFRRLPDNCPGPVCRIYCHPDDWSCEDDVSDDTTGGRTDGEKISVTSAPWSRQLAHPVGTPVAFFARPLPTWKRCLDVVGASIGLVLLSPLFVVVAAAIKLASPGAVFFRQNRSGLGGRRFTLYKFRSMVSDAEAHKRELLALNEQDGPAFKIRNDPRVTRLGRFLRKTSLDELPQLWNVLRGDMSLVGPRPLPCDETAACRGWHRRRIDVTPGLTCIWQVSGRSQVSFADWARMDLRYIRSRSLPQDLLLLAKTVKVVAFSKDAC